MTTSELNQSPRASIDWRGHIARSRAAAPPLFWVGAVMLALSVMVATLGQFDVRQFQGVGVWVKPWKFLVSTGVYLLTLALFMSWLSRAALRTRTANYVVWVAVTTGVFEVAYVALKASQGAASHFNISTRLDATMYSLMGVGAVFLISASLALAVLLARRSDYALSPHAKLAIVLGLIMTFVLGSTFGGYMSAQAAGHWVGGVRTDAGGVPVMNWSRTGGDLRVAHFLGVHAMHFVPAFALLLTILGASTAWAKRAIWAFAALFTALCIWTLAEARAGRSIWP